MQLPAGTFRESVEAVRRRIGKHFLSDDELLLLACEELSHTVSYEEKEYRTGEACEES